MTRWGALGLKKDEAGYFFLDVLGGIFVVMAMVVGLAYVNVQLSHLPDVEGQVTAVNLAAEQMDKLCADRDAGDLGVRLAEGNGHKFQIISSEQQGSSEGTVCYQVDVEWQGRRAMQHFSIQKEVCITR